MAAHHELGKAGEKMAVELLEKKGYAILETNWRYQKAEVDIIAIADGMLVIVEVKTRSSANYGEPAEAVNKSKQRLLSDAAHAYLEYCKMNYEVRFDIISIIINSKNQTQLHHMTDAFYPFSNDLDG